MEKIRVHKGNMQTKYGVDYAHVYDDPVNPQYTEEQAIEELMSELGYIESGEDDGCEYPGTYEGCGAYFEYNGYADIIIPESIVQRIKNS